MYDERCAGCDGDGVVKCPICNPYHVGIPGKDGCRTCHGEGKIVCAMCGGVGRILVDDHGRPFKP